MFGFPFLQGRFRVEPGEAARIMPVPPTSSLNRVGLGQGAVPCLSAGPFPRPSSEPNLQFSKHPALHKASPQRQACSFRFYRAPRRGALRPSTEASRLPGTSVLEIWASLFPFAGVEDLPRLGHYESSATEAGSRLVGSASMSRPRLPEFSALVSSTQGLGRPFGVPCDPALGLSR